MPNPIRILDNKDFDFYGNIVDMDLKRGKTIVLFYADYCPACRNFKPTFKQLEEMGPMDVNIAMVPIDKNSELMKKMHSNFPYTVPYIPTVVSYDSGSYYSTYDYGEGEQHNFRTLPDLVEYVNGIGTAPIQLK